MKLRYLILTVMPWIELRGAIPLAIKDGEYLAVPFIMAINILIFFPTYYGLELMRRWVKEGSWLSRRLKVVEEKSAPLVRRYGLLGLAVFVMIPLPGTGAYSGTAAAWLLGFRKRTAFFAVALGVILAGIIVSLISLSVRSGLFGLL
ncbi:MAG: small multi-drug export protein [Actinomycetota bacterium]|nr:small multi-drug export protein [Actinomycetota bacterium]